METSNTQVPTKAEMSAAKEQHLSKTQTALKATLDKLGGKI